MPFKQAIRNMQCCQCMRHLWHDKPQPAVHDARCEQQSTFAQLFGSTVHSPQQRLKPNVSSAKNI
jgi:hypothetical protein